MRTPLIRLLSCAFFSFTLLPLVSKAQGATSATTSISATGLQEDVVILRATFEQLHPGLYRYNTKEQMDAAFDRLRGDFSHDQTLEQAFVRLSQFTAQIRCGHTFPSPYNQSKEITAALFGRTGKLPFLYRWIGLRMIVTRDLTPKHSLPVSTEIFAINGIPAGDILKRLLPLVSADGGNDAKRIDLAQEQGKAEYEAPEVYLPMIFPGWSSPFRMQVKRPGSKAIATVEAIGSTTAERKSALAADQPDLNGSQPLFQLRYLPDGTAVLTMPTWVMFHSKWDWKTWLNASLDEVIERKAPALILNLRGNVGGDDVGALILARLESVSPPEQAFGRLVRYRKVPSELLPHLSTWDRSFKDWGAKAVDLPSPWPTAPPVPYFRQVADKERQAEGLPVAVRPFKGKVYVLTDASNSSATFGFARTIQDEHLGVLVGEPTGGNKRGINGGAFFFLTLPNSRIEIDLPLIGYFPADAQPDGGLVPDVLVKLSVQDIRDSLDPNLGIIESLLRSAKIGTVNDSLFLACMTCFQRRRRYVWTLRSTCDEESDSRLVRCRSRTLTGVPAKFQYRAADVSACGAALAGVGRDAWCLPMRSMNGCDLKVVPVIVRRGHATGPAVPSAVP